MEVKRYQVGPIGTNCYFVGDEATKKGCIIDPGDEGARLVQEWEKFGYSMEAILLTHGHYDHTTGLPEVAAAFPGAPIYVHQEDVCQGGKPEFYQCAALSAMHYVHDGDTITVGSIRFTVLRPRATPPAAWCFRQIGRCLPATRCLPAAAAGWISPAATGARCASACAAWPIWRATIRSIPAMSRSAPWTTSARATPLCARPCAWAEQ